MFPAELQSLIDTAVNDRAKAIKGVAEIAKANAALEAARQAVTDATQSETDATAAAAQSEPAAVAAFTQWLRDQATVAANPPAETPTTVPAVKKEPVPAEAAPIAG
ncbi:MAG: hypothetical protein E6Q40_08830 [Cupriavidus sp.]|nr:MAG: hypothetical protein E6Q40_08830 [Cupriavidus sp.]